VDLPTRRAFPAMKHASGFPRFSSPFTVAGPHRIFTDFPFHPFQALKIIFIIHLYPSAHKIVKPMISRIPATQRFSIKKAKEASLPLFSGFGLLGVFKRGKRIRISFAIAISYRVESVD
jgi:hypothetical protein